MRQLGNLCAIPCSYNLLRVAVINPDHDRVQYANCIAMVFISNKQNFSKFQLIPWIVTSNSRHRHSLIDIHIHTHNFFLRFEHAQLSKPDVERWGLECSILLLNNYHVYSSSKGSCIDFRIEFLRSGEIINKIHFK